MTPNPRAEARASGQRSPLLPHEHGFWVILGVVVLSALSRSGGSRAVWFAAGLVVLAAVTLARFLNRFIRRSDWLQVAAAAALSGAGIPIQLAAGTGLSATVADASVWVVVFAASALSVRTSFARASRSRNASSTRLALGSVLLPAAAALFFALASLRAHTAAALIAAAGLGVLALVRPGVKQMRAIGLSLAAIAIAAAIALVVRP